MIKENNYSYKVCRIKKDRTPRGDGNLLLYSALTTTFYGIKKDRTPRGDGNYSLL